MKFTLLFVCASFILLLRSDVAQSITCYQCSTLTQSNCADPVNVGGIGTCQGHECIKTKLTASNGSTTVTTRDCFIGGVSNTCREYSEGSYTGVACYCDTEKCNSGHMIHLSAMTSFIIASLVFLFVVY